VAEADDTVKGDGWHMWRHRRGAAWHREGVDLGMEWLLCLKQVGLGLEMGHRGQVRIARCFCAASVGRAPVLTDTFG
jgi:hypothetical protein